MKKKAYYLLGIAAAAALILSCIQPLDPPPVTPASAGTGRVVLTASTGSGGSPAASSRTALPAETPAFSRYALVFNREGFEDINLEDDGNLTGSGLIQELEGGTWTVTVGAYRTFTVTSGWEVKEYLAARGSETLTVEAGQITEVTVNLLPIPIEAGAPKGIFTYKVSFPNGASGTLAFGNEAAVSLTSGSTVSVEKDPGYYDLAVSVTNASGALSAGVSEAAHIYSGLETRVEFDFTEADFAETLYLAGILSLPEEIDWEAVTGTIAVYSGADYTGQIGAAIPAADSWIIGVPATYTGSTLYIRAKLTGTDTLYSGETSAVVTKAGAQDLAIAPIEVPLNYISIAALPGTTSYTTGDAFSSAGLALSANYSGGSTAPITSGWTFAWNGVTLEEGSTDITAAAGTKYITVVWKEKTVSFSIIVRAADVTLNSISIAAQPGKTSYTVGEPFSSAGLALNAAYSDNTTDRVTSGWTLISNGAALTEGSTAITAAAGTKYVTVIWKQKTAGFYITVEELILPAAATPAASPPAGKYDTAPTITLSTATEGAVIYYTTNGNDPGVYGYVYSGPFTLSPFPGTVKAVAVKSGMNNSGILAAEYTQTEASAAVTPAAEPPAGAYSAAPTITLSTATEGAVIYYTTDGSDPNAYGSVYSGPFTLSPFPGTVKAVTVKSGMNNSGVLTAEYTHLTVTASNLANLAVLLEEAQGGNSVGSPLELVANLRLTNNNWESLLSALASTEKYVNLDLSACDAGGSTSGSGLYSDGTFAPIRDTATGEPYIVSLTLPDVATKVQAGTTSYGAFRYYTSLKSVSSSNVGTIGNYAFVGCSGLEIVSLPVVETIGMRAFSGCGALETLNLSATLVTFDGNAFIGCSNLTNITIPPENPQYSARGGMLLDKAGTTLIKYPSATAKGSVTTDALVTAIDEYAFKEYPIRGYTTLTELNLPAVETIPNSAFMNCTALKTVSLPVVTYIADSYYESGNYYGVFSGCTALETVNLPEATYIGDQAFYNLTVLKTVNLPKATDIGTNAFSNTALETVSLPKATDIGASAFSNTALKTVNLPVVETIGNAAFSGCRSLETVNFPEVITIEDGYYDSGNSYGVFSGCTALEMVNLPKATSIGDYAFYNTALEIVSLPEATSIGDYAFSNTALETISLLEATSIGDYAFSNTALEIVSLPKATSIGDYAFYNTALEIVSLPEATDIGRSAFMNCSVLKTVDLPKVTAIVDGSLSLDGSLSSGVFYGCIALETVNLPEATYIGDYAFAAIIIWGSDGGMYTSALKEVSFPKATSIGRNAFYHCYYLTTVDLPEVTDIGQAAFFYCLSLETVNLPEATYIGMEAFYNCTTLETLSFLEATSIGRGAFQNCTALVSVDLPKVTAIEDSINLISVFTGCTALETVNLPEATYIGMEAFFGCISLETVNLPKATSIGYLAFSDTGSTALTVTLGSTAPTLSSYIFVNIDDLKSVTVKVPSGATGYGSLSFDNNDTYANNWGNAFRGIGWNGTSYLNGNVNSNITLTIEEVNP